MVLWTITSAQRLAPRTDRQRFQLFSFIFSAGAGLRLLQVAGN